MYKYLGSTDIYLYDLLGVLGYLPIIFSSFSKKRLNDKLNYPGSISLYLCDYFSLINKKSKYADLDYWAKKENSLVFIIQVLSFTFSGEVFGSFIGARTDVYGYLIFTPIFMYIFCYLLGVNPLKQLDVITPSSAFVISFLKIGCFTAGCCSGFEWSYGFYNHVTERREFPIQLIEALIYFIIFIFITCYKDKIKKGTLYPMYITVYSFTKFLLQFFRADEKIFLVFNIHHCLSFIGFFIGLIWLVIVIKYNNSIANKFNRKISIKIIENKKADIINRKKKKKKRKSNKRHK